MLRNTHIKFQSIFLLLTLFFGSAVALRVVQASCTADSVTCLAEENQAKADDLNDKLDSIDAKIKAYQQIVDLKERQGATLAEQIDGLQAQTDKLQLEIDTTTKQIQDLEEQIKGLSLRIAEKSILIDRQKQILSQLMQIYYSDFSGDITPTLLTSAESLLYFEKEGWTANVSDKVSEILESVKALRSGLANEQKQVSDKKNEVDALYADQAERNANLVATQQSKARLLNQTQVEATKYTGLVDDLQKQRDDIEQEIYDLESGLSKKGLPNDAHGLLSYPVKNVTISQKYGKATWTKMYSFHNGIDLAGPVGTSIYAAADGKVVGMGNLGKYAYGMWLAIDHGNGMITLYGHLSATQVSLGEKVVKGDKIASMGNTGYTTGPHLHFTVFASDSYEVVPSSTVKGLNIPIGGTVNPSTYLP